MPNHVNCIEGNKKRTYLTVHKQTSPTNQSTELNPQPDQKRIIVGKGRKKIRFPR